MAQACALCSLDFKNEEQLKQHIEGKRHKKMESIKEERENSAMRSIFVSGIKKDTFVKQIEEYFGKFGKINKIIQDQEKNAYAIIEYSNEASVESVLACKNEHKVNEKNIKVTRREVKEFISRISNNADKKKEIVEKMKEEALAVNTLLGKCETFDDQVDHIIKHLELGKDQLELREKICLSLNSIFKQFWNEREFQVSIFGSTKNDLACKGSDMDLTILFNDYLKENQLKQLILPKIVHKQIKEQKQKHGQDSSDSNMADEVEMDENDDSEDLNEDENNNDTSLKESIVKFFNNKEYKEFLKFDIEHQIKILGKIIQRQLVDLVQVKTITNTRCPVVRFLRDKENINCDLSLNNFLANENTKLIKLYMDLEPNLRKLVFVLRYWIKQKNLYSKSRFNSYTIIWLVIFYMQTKKIGNLPTVEKLSKISNKDYKIHGWKCDFETDINKIKSLESKEALTININCINDLLKGFFEFYSNFRFSSTTSNVIICTRTATIIEVNEKSDLTKISPYINVQDPFDLSHNLTANVSKTTVERFITECKGSNDLLTYSVMPRKSLTKCWGLILLMTKKVLPILSPNPSNKVTISAKDLIEKSMLNLKLFDESQAKTQEKITIAKAIEFVIFLVQDCLLFKQLEGDKLIVKKRKRPRVLNQICDKVDLLELNNSPKRLRTNFNTSEDSSNPSNSFVSVVDEYESNYESNEDFDAKMISSHQFNALNNTWQGRRAIKREIKQKNESLDELKLEKLVSLKLTEMNLNKPVNYSKGFNFAIHFLDSTSEKKSSNLQIKFELLDEVESQNDLMDFHTLVHFLDVYMNNSFEKLFSKWVCSQAL